METITFDLKDRLIENFKRIEPLVLNAYNQNFVTKTIDLFSKEQEKHTGILSYDKSDSELMQEIEEFSKKEGVVDVFRITSTDFLRFMFSGFIANGKKRMYMTYFSFLQFQTGIVDIGLNEPIKTLKVELPYKSNASFCLFTEGSRKTIPLLDSSVKELCVIAENKSSLPQKINLLDSKFKNGFSDSDIKIEFPINDIGNDEVLNSSIIRVFSENKKQLSSVVSVSNSDSDSKIEQSSYWSHNQFQSIGIDIPIKMEVKFDNKFEITLLPNTKIMYMFYCK